MDYICQKIRRKILVASYRAGACHIGSALSCVEILVALYYKIIKEDDLFIFSKASGVATLYAILEDKGIIPKGKVSKYLKKYPLCSKEVPSVVWSGGSLGMGLSVALGVCLSDTSRKVYCLISDGELDEGQTWEAILFSSHHKLNNLVVICDRNFLQACGKTEKVLKLEPLEDKFKSFNCDVKRIDGHNLRLIKKSLKNWESNKPKVLICDTIKGKGVSFCENDYTWHYRNLSQIQLKQALQEL